MIFLKSKKVKGFEQAFWDWYAGNLEIPDDLEEFHYENNFSYHFYFVGGLHLLSCDLKNEFRGEKQLLSWKYKTIKQISEYFTEEQKKRLKNIIFGKENMTEKEAEYFDVGMHFMGLFIVNTNRNPESFYGLTHIVETDYNSKKN